MVDFTTGLISLLLLIVFQQNVQEKPMSTRTRTELYWIEQYRRRGALWSHDGNPKWPHPLITSNQHSDSYTNSELVLEDPSFLDEACHELIKLLRLAGLDLEIVDRVIAPEKGGIKISHDIARHVTRSRNRLSGCLSAYGEKAEKEGQKKMVLSRFAMKHGEHILPAEDVLTTGGSVQLTALAAEEAGAIVLPYVAVLVNSSGRYEVNGRKIVSLIYRPIPTFTAEKCPLCKIGSEAIRPKGKNWSRFIATY